MEKNILYFLKVDIHGMRMSNLTGPRMTGGPADDDPRQTRQSHSGYIDSSLAKSPLSPDREP